MSHPNAKQPLIPSQKPQKDHIYLYLIDYIDETKQQAYIDSCPFDKY